ncbi:MAG: MBOAT family O-acyltransferase, partial [Pseudobdellovibrio sp.]
DWRKGIYLFVYGVFKKRVIADFLSAYVDQIFGSNQTHGFVVFLSIISAATQIYCDVSGYADMARGIAAFFGIDLTRNFNFPYFCKNPVDFWKRWHISLSMWIRHYVHTPLITRIRHANVVIYIVFILMGIWHGAQWKYIEWGIYWATVSVVYQYFLKPYVVQKVGLFQSPWMARCAMIPVMFIGQSFWRTEGFSHLTSLLVRMSNDFFEIKYSAIEIVKVCVCVLALYSYETWLYRSENELKIAQENFYVQSAFYVALYFLYRNIGTVASVDFIYFHF